MTVQQVEQIVAAVVLGLMALWAIAVLADRFKGRGSVASSPPGRDELDVLKRRVEAGATNFSDREIQIAPFLHQRDKAKLLRLMDQQERFEARRPALAAATAYGSAHQVERTSVPLPAAPKPKLLDALVTDVIHLMLVGGSGAGKTTVTRALARKLVGLGHRVLVGDPKVMGPTSDKWPGCEVFGDLDEFVVELRAVKAELDRRVIAGKQGYGNFPHVWVVLDEYWRVWPQHGGIRAIIEEILRLAREYNIHLVLGSQDNQAASMGLEGKTKLMNNFTWVVELKFDTVQRRRWANFCHYVAGALRVQFTTDVPELPRWEPVVRDYSSFVVQARAELEPPTPEHELLGDLLQPAAPVANPDELLLRELEQLASILPIAGTLESADQAKQLGGFVDDDQLLLYCDKLEQLIQRCSFDDASRSAALEGLRSRGLWLADQFGQAKLKKFRGDTQRMYIFKLETQAA